MESDTLIEAIQGELDSLCQKIKSKDTPYRFPTVRQDNGFEHLEVLDDQYHVVVTERGLENSRNSTQSKDELLYWLVSSFTWASACAYELENRIEGQDCRRMLFDKQVGDLRIVNDVWADKKQAEFDAILKEHPFNDEL